MSLTNFSVTIGASANVQLGVDGSLGNAQLGSQDVTSYESGTGDTAADCGYGDTHTVTNPTATTIDFRSGTIKQPNQASASYANIKLLRIRYVSGTGILTYGGGSNPLPGVSGTLENPGDEAIIHKPEAGIAVTNGSADTLTLSSSSGSIVVNVSAFGDAA